MKNIKKVVKDSIWFGIYTAILLFLVIFILVSDNGLITQKTFGNALTINAGYFGGIATLVAAFIASRLFNDWKVQHNNTTLSQEALKVFRSLEEYKLKIETYTNSIRNKNNLGNIFTEPYKTIFNKEIILSDELRELKLHQDSCVVDIRMLLALLPDNVVKETPKSIGLDDVRECFARNYVFTQKNYILKPCGIDPILIINTTNFKDEILEKISITQNNLKKFIIFNIDPNE